MSEAMDRLILRLRRETRSYRKGEPVVEKSVGGVAVVEHFGFPLAPNDDGLVDVHFIKIGFIEANDRDGFVLDFEAATKGDGEFCNLSIEDFRGGPSYITIGGWIGSQQLALELLALGAHYQLWSVITPATLGFDGEAADDLAGKGMVYCGGYNP